VKHRQRNPRWLVSNWLLMKADEVTDLALLDQTSSGERPTASTYSYRNAVTGATFIAKRAGK
jgi:hypothetical protein